MIRQEPHVAALVAIAVLACAGSATASARSRIAVSQARVDLGVIDANTILQKSGPTSLFSVTVASASSWTLFSTLENDPSAPVAGYVADRIEVRRLGEPPRTMLPGMPVAIAAGEANGEQGSVVPIELRVVGGIDSRPGARSVNIRFATIGEQQVESLRLIYSIPVLTHVDADPRPFVSPAVNPARSGIYRYEQRSYTVRSNVPWVAEAFIAEAPTTDNSLTLPTQALGIVTNEVFLPFEIKHPLVIAKGAPTPDIGETIELRLAIRIRDDLVVGGDYRTAIRVEARPADETK